MSEESEIQPSEKPSKSQRKKDMTGLQDLGEELTKLKRVQLDKIPLSEAMAGAIHEFTRLNNSHEARRRQLQFIGKLMRKEDHQEISTQLQKLRNSAIVRQPRNTLAAAVEQLSQILLTGNDNDINETIATHPSLERQTLRQLVRNYQKSTDKEANRYKKKLTAYLNDSVT